MLLATGHPDGAENENFLVAIRTSDGQDQWIAKTPAGVVKGGTAMGDNGRLYVALEDGSLLCFDPRVTP
jgi:outer membrane protein assembly factor BamB